MTDESPVSSRQTLGVEMTPAIVSLSEKVIEQLLPAHVEMPRYVSEHGGEGTDREPSVAPEPLRGARPRLRS